MSSSSRTGPYLRDEAGALIAAGHDGVFYDEYGSGGMSVAYASLEMDTDAYQAAAVAQMAAEKVRPPRERLHAQHRGL